MPLFFFFIILFSFSAAAETNYSQVGTEDQDFRLSGPGFWNSGRSDTCGSGGVTCQTRNIGSPQLMPLVADLDADGINEIIVVDGISIRLFRNSDLEIVDAFTSTGDTNNILLFDIDGDNLTEVILAHDSSIEIVEYNGSSIFQQTNFTADTADANIILTQCRGVNDCVNIAHETSGADSLNAIAYNSTGVFISATVIATETTYCSSNNLPNDNPIPIMAVADLDGQDGIEEYIFSIGELVSAGNAILHVISFDVNGTTNIIPLFDYQTTLGTDSSAGTCVDLTGYTSPLVFDIDSSSSNGLEIVVGFMNSDDSFKMHSLTSSGVFSDDYPEALSGEGILISNVFRVNVFSDTASEDFCVFGYENVESELELVCASEQTGEVPETNTFEFDTTGFVFNVSAGYNLVTHSTQQTSTLTDGNNLDEIINSYGVFILDKSDIQCSLIGLCDLELIWENPQGDSVLYPVDVEKIGADDLLALTDTNLWYLDDGFTNSNAEVSRYTTDPSIQSVIQVNESPQVTITCTDIDGDFVQARLITYLGEANEQDTNFSVLSGSGSTFPFSFEANLTTASSNLRLMCRDSEHNISDNITIPFSVSNVGSQVGDSFFDSGELLIEVEEDVAGVEVNLSNNAIRNTIEAIDGVANTGLGNGIIWLIIMAAVAYMIWTSGIAGKDSIASLGIVAIVEVILLMIGIRLQFLSMIYLFVFIIVVLAILAVRFRRELTGG